MGKLFTVCFLLLCVQAYPQEALRSLKKKGATRAVVVGISDYQDPQIIDLSYADLDADSFAVFLKSKSGGLVQDQHIQLLTNQEATMARIQSALEWLLKNTEKEDQAIIYFSGHGDVETKNDQEKGYILAYDTPKNNYRLNAVDLDWLNRDIIGKLSEKGAKVIVITDACHSGSLAGGENGKEATAMELMKRFESEVKVMSCQPYELSRESSKYHRGVFSFFLIEGLKGFADEDDDKQVDLYELEHYLQDRVRNATDKNQHPDVLGGLKEEALFQVDEATMEALSGAQKSMIESDFEKDMLRSQVSPEGYMQYLNFNAALKKGHLVSPEGDAAVYYYDALYADTSCTPLRGIIDERLAVAFMDSVQQAINAYLNTDPQELAQRNRYDQKYVRFSEYLRRTAEILGSKDSRYRQTLAKKYYFEGLALRLNAEQSGGNGPLYRQALEKQDSALQLEKSAAYIYNELGYLHLELGAFDEGMNDLRKAVELSPTWAIPYNNLAIGYKQADSLGLAKTNYLRAIALKPDFASVYSNLGSLYFLTDQIDSAEFCYRKSIELDSTNRDAYYDLGLLLSQQDDRRPEAVLYYERALQLDSQYVKACFELANVYNALQLPDSAEILYRQAMALDSTFAPAFLKYGELKYLYEGQNEEAETLFLKSLALDSANAEASLYLGVLYIDKGRPEAAERRLLESLKFDPASEFAYILLIGLYAQQWEKAVQLLRDAPLDTLAKIRIWCEAAMNFADSQSLDEAQKAFGVATGLDPAEPLVYFTRCLYFVKRNQEREALDNLEKALAKAKARKLTAEYLEQINASDELAALRQNKRYQSLIKRYSPSDRK